ncbi:MAG: Hpt domain-containing protein, partial [Syntrophales bacterium LBB04]|nr:Hpt domain-containing protein [Syntrophales bacterium LBB04]
CLTRILDSSPPPPPAAITQPMVVTKLESGDLPIDYRAALIEFGEDQQLLDETLEGFLQNVEEQIGLMRTALPDQQWEVLRLQAHSIKGGASNLLAKPLAEAASHLQQAAAKRQVEIIPQALQELIRQAAALKSFLCSNIHKPATE